MEKSSKEYSVVFLVEGEKFNLGKKNRRYSSGEKFKFASSVLFELGQHTVWVRSFSQRFRRQI